MKEKKHIFIILIINIFMISTFVINNPLEFQCDSAFFYNYASLINNIFKKYFFYLFFFTILIFFLSKKIKSVNPRIKIRLILFILLLLTIFYIFLLWEGSSPFRLYDFTRPPLYPIFLFSTGIYFFDSFHTLIIIQGIFSLISIFLIHKILFKFTSCQFAFWVTVIYSVTSIPYILIKFIIAEQLLYFLSVLFVYFIFAYNIKKKEKYLMYAGILASLTWLTKAEGQLIFFVFIFFLFLNIFAFKKIFFSTKIIIKICIIPLLIIFIYTSTRSFIAKDFSNLFRMSISTYDQFFYKFYTVLPSEIFLLEKEFKITNSYSGKFISKIFPDQPIGTIIIRYSNGKSSEELYEHIYKYLLNNPESFNWLKKPFEDVKLFDKNKSKIDLYYELFEKFEGDMKRLTDNMFDQPNIYYFNFINQILNKKLSNSQKDNLFRNVIFESLLENKIILIIFLNDFFLSYGIDIQNYIVNNKFPIGNMPTNLSFINAFNEGGCGKNNLSSNHFNEYKESHDARDKFIVLKFISNISDFINDLIRNYSGIFLFIGFIFLILKNYKLYLPIIFFPLSYDFLLAITVDANYDSKYEVITFTWKYILLSLFVYKLITFKKNSK